ncbi:MAG: 2-oxoacid:acceptor oxidoreductase family protein, partial [Bacteroidales bacterium]
KVYRLDAMDIASQADMKKVFNMIILGGYLKLCPIVSVDSVMKGLKKTLPERHHKLLPLNEEAIMKGMEAIGK